MANQEHLAILAKGVKEWNTWRSQTETTLPDLSEARLRNADLAGANLRGANLIGAHLSGAELRRAKLYHAQLIGADLRRAQLNRAHLNGADLSGANLSAADLSRANLNGADLVGANLSHTTLRSADLRDVDLSSANLSDARFSNTLLGNANLSTAKGLDTATHHGPSTIGIDTIYLSRGNIPEVFLRGAGVPENFIAYVKSLTGNALDFYSCFISYSTQDQEFANRLHADLQAKGVRCWFAPHDIQAGRKVHEQIDEAIRMYDKLLLILSDASMNSNWVKTEVANARAKEHQQKRQMLFPLTLVPFDRLRGWKLFDADTGIDSAREIREYFIPDFSNWKDHDSWQNAFDRLLRDLKATPGAIA